MGEGRREALQILRSYQHLPRLVVFDLDYTLWPFCCHMRCKCEVPKVYPQVRGILYALKEMGVGVGIASRSPAPDIADAFLCKLGAKCMLVAEEVFPSWSPKTEHFQRIHGRTGVAYDEMLFFDDDARNIEAVSKMGVTTILVGGKGVDVGALWQGLAAFSKRNRFAIKPPRVMPVPPHNLFVHPEVLLGGCCKFKMCLNCVHMRCKFKMPLGHHRRI